MSSGVVRSVRRKLLVAGMLLLATPSAAAITPDQRDWLAARLADNGRGRYSESILVTILPRASDPLAEAIVEWDRLRRDDYPASFDQLSAFLRSHPGWPSETALRRRAERSLSAETPMADRLAYFDRMPPTTASGRFRYAEALLASGRRADAIQQARRAWASDGLSQVGEAELLARFGSQLTPADHYARADRLLWSGQTSAAQRVFALVPADRRPLLAARLAFRADAPDAATLVAALPDRVAADPGLIVDRVNWLRRAGRAGEARDLMAATQIVAGSPLDAVRWLTLRLELAREASRDGHTDLAYRLAATHRTFPLGRPLNSWGDKERDLLTDIEWLAGWTALKVLGQPGNAVDHFQNYRNAAQSPLTQARGDYWAGRAAEAARDRPRARRFLESAGTHPDYFFGQLALERLNRPISLPAQRAIPVAITARQAFEADERVRAARLLGDLGDRARQTLFLRNLVDGAETPERQRLLADLSPQLGRPDIGVLVGRAARNVGELSLVDAAYPRMSLSADLASAWTMIHAITRQESRFDRAAVSSAKAQGLMQLMPGTARETAAKAGLAYDAGRLTTDEQYNLTLGSTYFQGLLGRWGGNHVLAVASYNAGPGNVNKWIRANGDPRDPGVDVIDWIEAIPFEETRVYVWRVLENAVVYDALHPERRNVSLAAYLGRPRNG